MNDRLRRFAFARPTAFAVVGWDGDAPLQSLLRAGLIQQARAPHDGDLLLLSGRIPDGWSEALRALFETFALPRLAVWLRPDQEAAAPEGLPLVELDPAEPDLRPVLDRLLDPAAANNRPLLADEPPAPWRGKGDHGQGGEGMMGGKPYGRPMAMVGDDPDGLMLGALPTALGPFFPGLPCGLQLTLSLQGERVSSVDGVRNWFPDRPAAEVMPAPDDRLPVPDLERARIVSHLRVMAAVLELAGLPALARRFQRADTTDGRQLRRLFEAAERRGLPRVLQGVGHVERERAQELALAGPVARACGLADDARSQDPAYRGAGFVPVTAQGGDAWARWSVLRDECLQAAALISQLKGHAVSAAAGPRGASRANLRVLEHLLPGLLWPDALLAVASLGLDMREAALR